MVPAGLEINAEDPLSFICPTPGYNRLMSITDGVVPPAEVLARWRRFTAASIRPLGSGLINATFELRAAEGERVVLQRLHPVFAPEVNLDIAAVTEHLAGRGLRTQRILPTDDGCLWVEAADGIWRALSYVPGSVHQRLTDPAMAREAGRLVGCFHCALDGFDYDYRSRRGNVHDTPAHLQRLHLALERHAAHRLYGAVAAVAEPLLRGAEGLLELGALPLRHAHGDLKISNLLFDEVGRGLCLIDLDTLTRMHWPLEMGDALRSWCNPATEERRSVRFDPVLFQAALGGYRESAAALITAPEWAALVPGLARICLELAARFLADALNETYFGWDPRRFGTRGEHNLARGRAMWALYRDVLEKRAEAERVVEKVIRYTRHT